MIKTDRYTGLSNIKGFLLDMDGTFCLSNTIYPGSLHFMEVLRKKGMRHLFMTNNSTHDSGFYAQKLTDMGFPQTKADIVTSGEAAACYLHRLYPNGRLYVCGTPSLESELCNHGFTLCKTAPDAVLIGFDTTLTYDKLWKLCDYVRLGIPYYATHPDFNCPIESITGYMPDIGGIIAFVEATTGVQPKVIGKPNREIVDIAIDKLGLNLNEIAVVGDRLYTDIAAGHNAGMLTVLVLSGETKIEDVEKSEFKPDYVFEDLGAVADRLEKLDL